MQKLHNTAITVLFILVMVLFFFLAFGKRGYVDVYNLKQEVRRLNTKNQKLEAENNELRRTIYRLLEDPEYVEAIAREELGMVGQDEIIYQFKENQKKAKE